MRSANGFCSPATSPNSRRCRLGRSCLCWRSWPVHRLRAQLLPGAPRTRAGPSAGTSPATPGSAPCTEAACIGAESGVELGHHLSADQRPGRLVLPLSGDRRLEPQGRRLGCRRTGNPAIAADLVSRACLRERISKGRRQPLTLHADNGNAMRAATLESRLEELGVLRSFSRPRVSNDNPYSESLFRTAKYRPDYPRRPFASKDDACQWVSSFVDWYNHRHRHSGIKFVTPHQRHNGHAVEICRQRAVIYEQARQRNPRRWSRSTRCWRQPKVVWINPPPPELQPKPTTFAMAA
jgi:transposase InsO family protein